MKRHEAKSIVRRSRAIFIEYLSLFLIREIETANDPSVKKDRQSFLPKKSVSDWQRQISSFIYGHVVRYFNFSIQGKFAVTQPNRDFYFISLISYYILHANITLTIFNINALELFDGSVQGVRD